MKKQSQAIKNILIFFTLSIAIVSFLSLYVSKYSFIIDLFSHYQLQYFVLLMILGIVLVFFRAFIYGISAIIYGFALLFFMIFPAKFLSDTFNEPDLLFMNTYYANKKPNLIFEEIQYDITSPTRPKRIARIWTVKWIEFKNMIANAAPKAAPWLTPKKPGSTRGFWKAVCMTRPARDNETPRSIALITRGRRKLINNLPAIWSLSKEFRGKNPGCGYLPISSEKIKTRIRIAYKIIILRR